ncbi:hypothetical protein MASR1M66_16180 [Aminivibrio sp.]
MEGELRKGDFLAVPDIAADLFIRPVGIKVFCKKGEGKKAVLQGKGVVFKAGKGNGLGKLQISRRLPDEGEHMGSAAEEAAEVRDDAPDVGALAAADSEADQIPSGREGEKAYGGDLDGPGDEGNFPAFSGKMVSPLAVDPDRRDGGRGLEACSVKGGKKFFDQGDRKGWNRA